MCGFFDGFLCCCVVCLGFVLLCAFVCCGVLWVLHVLFRGCGVCFGCALVCFCVLIVGEGLVLPCGLATEQRQNGERRIFGGSVGFVALRFIWYPALYPSVRS